LEAFQHTTIVEDAFLLSHSVLVLISFLQQTSVHHHTQKFWPIFTSWSVQNLWGACPHLKFILKRNPL